MVLKRLMTVATFLSLSVFVNSVAGAASMKSELLGLRDQAVALIKDKGLAEANKVMGDPNGKFLDKDPNGTGLHIWAAGANGLIVFDHSGQTVEGTDLSAYVMQPSGLPIQKDILKAIKENNGFVSYVDQIPHPVSNQMSTAEGACGLYDTDFFVCAMAWPK